MGPILALLLPASVTLSRSPKFSIKSICGKMGIIPNLQGRGETPASWTGRQEKEEIQSWFCLKSLPLWCGHLLVQLPQMLNFPWASSPDPEILSEELEVGGVAGGAAPFPHSCLESAANSLILLICETSSTCL